MKPVRMRRRGWRGVGLAAAVALPIAAGAAGAPVAPGSAPTFESHWQDGRAELDGYRYTVTRYGQPRRGTAVTVFVTEPFSEAKRVKVDDPAANPKDTFEALKLNFVRDFQTGIYDYNTLVSLFVRSRDFSPVKISFSSQEWCGHVYEEMLFGPREIADRYTSYFEDETGDRRLNTMKGGLTEEDLFVRLRDLREGWLSPGERRSVPFLASTFHRRLRHQPLRWTTASIERERETAAITVPAGKFAATVYRVDTEDGRAGRFWIERDYPHRILRWEWKATGTPAGRGWSPSEGLDAGELTGSARLPYWQLHNPGDEKYLKLLGLVAGPGGATAPGPAAVRRGAGGPPHGGPGKRK